MKNAANTTIKTPILRTIIFRTRAELLFRPPPLLFDDFKRYICPAVHCPVFSCIIFYNRIAGTIADGDNSVRADTVRNEVLFYGICTLF